MIPPKTGLLLIGLLLLCTAAAASEPLQITVATDTEWLVADGADSSAITAIVTDISGVPLKNVNVVFSCDTTMGSMKKTDIKTNPEGKAEATFKVGTKSGTAAITAAVAYDDDGATAEVSATCLQQIDHDVPYAVTYLDYDSEITVGSTTGIVIGMTDRHGNPVDTRRATETARFIVGSPSGSAGIYDGNGYVDDISFPVNESGYLTALFRADQVMGANIIYVDLPDCVTDGYILIYGIGNAAPATITCSVTPTAVPNPWIAADGESRFSIVYTLTDSYGNPAGGRTIKITALPSEDRTVTTNSDGLAAITYGPKETIGTVTLTATSVDDPMVSCSQTVEFISIEPVDMILTASPQSMSSLDVDAGTVASIRAKVVDEKGNPVQGETVTFTISNIDTAGYATTADPSLLESEAVTDTHGYATVRFAPGAFTLDKSDPAYCPTATGTCDVNAVWEGAVRTVDLKWKNYPYLSILTVADPETVEVNGTVNVTVILRGDGWALHPNPIDVVLAIDCSQSMAESVLPSGTKIQAEKNAARDFVGLMDASRDRIGIVPYTSLSAPVEVSLSSNYEDVNDAIDSLSPTGYTPTRLALKNALDDLINNPPADSNTIRAVVLMSDGAYNYFGDPLARGNGQSDYYYTASRYTTSISADDDYQQYGYCDGSSSRNGYDFTTLSVQNLSAYALANGIRIYCISFGDGIAEGDNTYDTMTVLAESTGGFHEHAPDAEKLAEIYRRIAGDLKTEAGVDTVMDLRFQSVRVNDDYKPGEEVYTYQHIDTVSTNIASWIDNETGHYVIVQPHTEDQTADWNDDGVLHFDIGTVRLGQVWTATYTLKTFMNGNVNVFGLASAVSFNNGSDTLELPDTFVTVIPELNDTGLDASTLDVRDLQRADAGPVTTFLQVAWTLNYTGTETAEQRLYYANDNGKTWNLFCTMPPVSLGERTQTANLDIRALPTGYYTIRVHAQAPDAPDDIIELPFPIPVGITDTAKIRIE